MKDITLWYVDTLGNLKNKKRECDGDIPLTAIVRDEKKWKEQRGLPFHKLIMYSVELTVFKIIYEQETYFIGARDSDCAKTTLKMVLGKEDINFRDPIVPIVEARRF